MPSCVVTSIMSPACRRTAGDATGGRPRADRAIAIRSAPWTCSRSRTTRSSSIGEEAQKASRLNPYLNFRGTAREALEFYRDVFGGELVLNTFGELGGPDAPTPENIMHGQLETPHGFTLMGSDGMPGGEYEPGTAFAVSLSGDDA